MSSPSLNQSCMTPPATDSAQNTPKSGPKKNFTYTSNKQFEDQNLINYGGSNVDIILIDSEGSIENTIKHNCNSGAEQDRSPVENNPSFPTENDLNSVQENISVGGAEDSYGLGPDNIGLVSTSDSERSETELLKRMRPFSDKKRTHLLRKVLRLGTEEFIRVHVHQKKIPILHLISLFDDLIPQAFFQYEDSVLIHILRTIIIQSTQCRPKLFDYNSITDCVNLIKKSKHILVVTGAGVSVSCGIPDFRSENGIYSRLDEFNLNDPQEMFCLEHFRSDPSCFYSFAKEIYPSNFSPSPSHRFIKLLEDHGKLLRNYTQNIDTLEQSAGINNVIQCHGSFATASCTRCRKTFPGSFIEEDIFNQRVPPCPFCKASDADNEESDENSPGILKPDIVFFGEGLPEEYETSLSHDHSVVDLLIVMGTSLKVRPVSEIPTFLPSHVPTILINRTPNTSIDFDIQLLGYSDTIVSELCSLLEWSLPGSQPSQPAICQKDLEAEWALLHKPAHWHVFPGAQSSEILASSLAFSSSSSSSNDGSQAELELGEIVPENPSPSRLPTPPIASDLPSKKNPQFIDHENNTAPLPKKRKVSAPPHHSPTPCEISPRISRHPLKPSSSGLDEVVDVDSLPDDSKANL